MAKKMDKQKLVVEKTSNVTIKFPKKVFLYTLIVLVVVGVIYFGGRLFFYLDPVDDFLDAFCIPGCIARDDLLRLFGHRAV